MKYEEIVNKVKDSFANVSLDDKKKHFAIQFNIIGEGEGAFYVELKDGSINVEPYEYYDRDVIFTLSAENLFGLLDGSLDAKKAYLTGKLKVSSIAKASEVKAILDAINKKKASAKKETKKVEPVKEITVEETTTKEPKQTTKTASATKSTTAKTTKATSTKKSATAKTTKATSTKKSATAKTSKNKKSASDK